MLSRWTRINQVPLSRRKQQYGLIELGAVEGDHGTVG